MPSLLMFTNLHMKMSSVFVTSTNALRSVVPFDIEISLICPYMTDLMYISTDPVKSMHSTCRICVHWSQPWCYSFISPLRRFICSLRYRYHCQHVRWHQKLSPVFASSLQGLLDSRQQRDETRVTHVLDLHHLLLVRQSVHMALEILHTQDFNFPSLCIFLLVFVLFSSTNI